MKILMLGWEFPPLFTGGLGVATYGMVKALSPFHDINLIIPRSDPKSLSGNFRVLGLNNVSESQLSEEQVRYSLAQFTLKTRTIQVSISPYHFQNEVISEHEGKFWTTTETGQVNVEMVRNYFSGNEIYGQNIIKKVYLFAHLAADISAKDHFEIIHCHDWITYPAGIRIKERTGKPLVIHVHALETDRSGENSQNDIYYLEKEGMTKADAIIAVSQFTKDQIKMHYGINADKIFVVHNGIDPLKTERKKSPFNEKLVVFLGRITRQKGPEFLLETAEKVTRVYPKVKFIVAGAGELMKNLLETAAYKKLGSKFIFTGFLSKDKVNEILQIADAYFMPSVSEPFGLTALEAAQYRIPAVLSRQSGATEVIQSSLKADFWDTDRFANQIVALLKYNALSGELSNHAERELTNLSWDHAADKISSVYTHIINHHKIT